jgi:hypothetical protein
LIVITLTADDATLARLRLATDLAEVRDSSGRVVGFFAPVTMDRARLFALAAAQTDPAEVRRRKEAGGKTHTTQEVVDHLHSLEKP